MIKRLTLLAISSFGLLTAACAEAPEPLRSPDAAELDRLVRHLDSEAREANAPDRKALPDQLAAVDRVSGTIERLPAERIDPNLVASALAR